MIELPFSLNPAHFGLSYWYAIYQNDRIGKIHAYKCLDYSEADVEQRFEEENRLFGWADRLFVVVDTEPADLPTHGYRPGI